MRVTTALLLLLLPAACRSRPTVRTHDPLEPLTFAGIDPHHRDANALVSSIRFVEAGRLEITEEVSFCSYGTCRTYQYVAVTERDFSLVRLEGTLTTSGSRGERAEFALRREGDALLLDGEARHMEFDFDTRESKEVVETLDLEIELDAPLALQPVRPYFLELDRGPRWPSPPRMLSVMELVDMAEPRPQGTPNRFRVTRIPEEVSLKADGDAERAGVRYRRYLLERGGRWWSWFAYWVELPSHRPVRFRMGDAFFEFSEREFLGLEKVLRVDAVVETRFESREEPWRVEFAFEEQRFARNAAVRLKNGAVPQFTDGDETVVILRHFEEREQSVIDDEFSYVLAVAIPEPCRPGTYRIGETCRTFLFYYQHGAGPGEFFARDGTGTVTIEKVSPDALAGSISLETEGRVGDEKRTVKIDATFSAKPK